MASPLATRTQLESIQHEAFVILQDQFAPPVPHTTDDAPSPLFGWQCATTAPWVVSEVRGDSASLLLHINSCPFILILYFD